MSGGAPEAKEASSSSAKAAPDAVAPKIFRGMLHQQSGKDGHAVLAPKDAPKAAPKADASSGVKKPRLRMLHRNSGKAGFKESRPSKPQQPPPQQQQQVPASDPVVFVEKKKD